MYWVNGLEHYDRKVKGLSGPWGESSMKNFVNGIAKFDKMPTKDEVIEAARKNPRLKKVWVMEYSGNKWRKAMDVIEL